MLESLSLFIGAFGDALIGPNLFVPGEPFMIAAGYQLYAGSVLGLIAVLVGGFLGDQASFGIGRKYGRRVQTAILKKRPKLRRKVAKGKLMLRRNERKVLVLARLLGPVAWVIPFIAGMERVKWHRFSFYSSIGLFLGVGQFVLWGYVLAMGIEKVPLLEEARVFFSEHLFLLITLGAVLTFYVVAKRFRVSRAGIKSFILLMIGIGAANYIHFFEQLDDIVKQERVVVSKDLRQVDYKVYAGRSAYYNAQAINVLYIGDSPREMMKALGWIENQTFSRNDISFIDYVNLIKSGVPPVSDLFWQGIPQEMAFQQPGTLSTRNHIRWWSVQSPEGDSSETRWFGALSYDNGLGVMAYSGLVTLLHTIEADVDKQRDALAQSVTSSDMWRSEFKSVAKPVVLDERHDYYTDGNILVVRPSFALAAKI